MKHLSRNLGDSHISDSIVLNKLFTEIFSFKKMSFDTLNKLKIVDLRQILKDNGIKISGSKKELVERILLNNIDVDVSKYNVAYTSRVKRPLLVDPIFLQSKAIDTKFDDKKSLASNRLATIVYLSLLATSQKI